MSASFGSRSRLERGRRGRADGRAPTTRADRTQQSAAQMLNAIWRISTDDFTWMQAEQMYSWCERSTGHDREDDLAR
jgi:hypothetical protein